MPSEMIETLNIEPEQLCMLYSEGFFRFFTFQNLHDYLKYPMTFLFTLHPVLWKASLHGGDSFVGIFDTSLNIISLDHTYLCQLFLRL